jgi:NAD(P)-dependent dehydrogenase (short-subunit alcohol dehydrogenase family)
MVTAASQSSSDSLENKAVLITGASRGLGAALARRLAARGARLALMARDREPLERLVAEIRAGGGEAHALAFDVGDKNGVYPLAGAAAALIGPIDVLLHNASTLGPTPLRLLLDTECEDFERVLAVNLVGPFRLSKVIAGSMALRGAGVIVHVSSDAAVAAYAHWGAYSASKAASDHLARIWAAELEGTGVRVFSVDPGEMDTEMHRAAIPDADPQTLSDPDRVAERIEAMIASSAKIPNGARLTTAEWSDAA